MPLGAPPPPAPAVSVYYRGTLARDDKWLTSPPPILEDCVPSPQLRRLTLDFHAGHSKIIQVKADYR